MTLPPAPIEVTCPDCGHRYVDWYRPSINLSLDESDDDYLEEASTTTCPKCGSKYDLGTLFAGRGDGWAVNGGLNGARRGTVFHISSHNLFIGSRTPTDFHALPDFHLTNRSRLCTM